MNPKLSLSRTFLLLVLAGAVSSILVADDSPPEKPLPRQTLEIPLFLGGYGIDFFQEAARSFEATHPGVTVALTGDPRVSDKLRIGIMEGSFPNATDANLPWAQLIEAGKIADLNPYLNSPGSDGKTPWKDSFQPGALEHWQVAGHTYAVPFPYAVDVVFYNKKIFREEGLTPPRTWTDFLSLCARLKAKGYAPIAFPGIYRFYADMILKAAYYNLVGPAGYRAYEDLAPGTRQNPSFIRAAALTQQLAREDFQDGWQGFTHTGAQLAFFQGRCAMMPNGSWLVSEMQGKIPDDFELGAFNLPVFADGIGDPRAIQVSSQSYFVFKRDPATTRLTVEFLRDLTTQASARRFVEKLDTPTAIRGIDPSAYSARMRDVATIIAQSTTTYGDPPGAEPSSPLLQQAYADGRDALLSGQIRPEDFAAKLEAAALRSRDLRQHPDRIDWRHPGLAFTFLAALAGVAAALFTGRTRRAPKSRVSNEGRNTAWPILLLFVAPALLLYAVFVLKPSAEAFTWSLYRWDGVGASQFVGVENFERLLFESDAFWPALGHNLFLMLVPTAIILPLSLFFATLISRGVRGGGVYRVCFFFPNILGGVAVTLLWLNAYEPQGGLVNGCLEHLGLFLQTVGLTYAGNWLVSLRHFAWLSPDHLYGSLIPMSVWGGCGFNMVLYLAAMESIDESYYEAARIDGASAWQQFRFVTLPLIWEVIIITFVFALIGGLKSFETIWLLTSQQPSTQTHVIGTLLVSELFQNYRVGDATAIGVLLFALVFLGTLALQRVMTQKEQVS
jgi:ABC-type sugar transport system permease subunit/ABC-type glycerol-3-phosphate transport system substrate-binding protein